MKRVSGLIILLILLTACGTQPLKTHPEIDAEATIWQQVGNFPNSTLQPRYFEMARDSLDNIYIAWIAAQWNTDLYIHKWNGSEWIQLGTSVASQASQSNFAISVGTDNQPVVAVSISGQLFAKRWNGSSWEQLGEMLTIRYPFGGAYEPSIAIDRSNSPFVSWSEGGDIYVKRWDGESWVQLSGILDTNANNDANFPIIALSRDGKPTVAWLEYNYANRTNALYVKSWNGYKWVQLGNSLMLDPTSYAQEISLSINRDSKPIVAWKEKDNLYVKQWDGSNWIQLGNIDKAKPENSIGEISLTTNRSGNPLIAWGEFGDFSYSPYPGNLIVKRWDGSNWVKVGLPVNTQGDVGYDYGLRISVLSNNVPFVAWWGTKFQNGGQEQGIFVHKRVGDEWLQQGEEVNWDLDYLNWPATNPSLVLRGTRPTLAYQHKDRIFIKSWIDNVYRWGWSNFEIGGQDPSLSLLKNRAPIMAYCEQDTINNLPGKIYVQYANILSSTPTNGSWNWEWLYLGDMLNKNSEHDAQHPSIVVGTDNRPVVTWQENDGTSWNVYVKRWNGTSWIQFGDTLDISLTGNAQRPIIAIGTDNKPVVAWYEENATTSRIYAKRWDGTNWIQLGGFINVSGSKKAYMPSLALDSLNNPVISWHEAGSTSNNVYVKRWDAATSSWVRFGTVIDISANANAENPSVKIGPNDYPTVAFQESGNVYVKTWNGTAWTQVSKAVDVNLADDAANPSLVLRSDGKPIVAWDETNATTSNIYVKRY